MLEFLVGLMLYAFWVSVILHFIVLFGLRIIYVIQTKPDWKKMLLILFLPFSYGYLKEQHQKSILHTIYQIVIIITFVCILIGGVMVIYTHYA